MIDEESEDTEAVEKLKVINDSIRRTIERYKLVKKGDFEGAANIPKGTLGTTTGVSKNANNELSLIDFDPEPSSNGGAAEGTTTATTKSSLEEDLLGLSFQDRPAPGPVNLGFGMFSLSFKGRTIAHKGADTPATATSSPAPSTAGASGNIDVLSSLSEPVSQSATPAPTQQPQQRSSPAPPADPFASLVSGSSRASSPFHAAPQSSTPQPKVSPPTSTLLDVGGAASSTSAQASTTTTTKESDGDEEWSFTSSLPENTLPSTHQVRVLSSSLTIDFASRRSVTNERQIQIVALFSNATGQPLTELHFQVAVEKVIKKNTLYLSFPAIFAHQFDRHTLSNFGRSLAAISRRCNRTGSGRTWPSTGSLPAKATRSRSDSKCRTALAVC